MAPLGCSGGSQFSSTVLVVVFPAMVSMRGGDGAVEHSGDVREERTKADSVPSHLEL